MNHMDTYKEMMNAFNRRKEQIHYLLTETSNSIREIKMNDTGDYLDELGSEMKNTTNKIILLGGYATGITTLVNALLGEVLFSHHYQLPYSGVREIKYGQTKEIVLHFHDFLNDSKCSNIPAKVLAYIDEFRGKNIPPLHIDYNELAEYLIVPEGDCLLESPYKKIEIIWPSDILKGGMEIIIPCRINGDKFNEKNTRDYLSKTDAVVFVLSAFRLCGFEEMTFIKNSIHENGIINPFFVVNHFDVLKENEKEAVKKYVEMKLSEFTTNPIYYISAQQALDGTVNGDDELIEKSGIKPFVGHLTSYLTNDKGKIKLSQTARELKRIHNKTLYEIIPQLKKMIDSSLDDVKARYEAAKPQLDTLKQKKEQFMSEMRLHIEQSKYEIQHVVNQNQKSITQLIPQWINEYTPAHPLGLIPTASKVSNVLNEITEYVSRMMTDQLKIWERNVMVPLVKAQLESIFQPLEEKCQKLNDEVEVVFAGMAKNNSESKPYNIWKQIPLESGEHEKDEMAKTIVENSFINLAISSIEYRIIDIFPSSQNAILLLANLLKNNLFGKSALTALKLNYGEIMVESIRNKANEYSIRATNIFSDEYMKIVNNYSSTMDQEINQAEQQVERIIAEMKKGQTNIVARKRELDSCESKVKNLSTELDTFIFELIEQKQI